MRVYISGPVTGMPDDNWEMFAAAERMLKSRGYEVTNPLAEALISLGPGRSHEDYMAFDLPLLAECDAIFLLPGWEASEGAVEEYFESRRRGITILHE